MCETSVNGGDVYMSVCVSILPLDTVQRKATCVCVCVLASYHLTGFLFFKQVN